MSDGTVTDFASTNNPFTGRMRWAEAPLAIGFGIGAALLAAGLFAALSVAFNRNQVAAAAAVAVMWMAGLGVIVGAWAARLRSLSVTDPLTGVFNRRFLAERLTRELQRARMAPHSALLFIDLDRLKHLNDHFGHVAGDRAIVAVADSILECVRAGDVVARVGGDEFNVLLTRTSLAEAEHVARRIGEALALRRGPWPEPLTISIGAAAVRRNVVTDADNALYQAKRFGGGRVVAAVASG